MRGGLQCHWIVSLVEGIKTRVLHARILTRKWTEKSQTKTLELAFLLLRIFSIESVRFNCFLPLTRRFEFGIARSSRATFLELLRIHKETSIILRSLNCLRNLILNEKNVAEMRPYNTTCRCESRHKTVFSPKRRKITCWCEEVNWYHNNKRSIKMHFTQSSIIYWINWWKCYVLTWGSFCCSAYISVLWFHSAFVRI